MQQVQEKQQQVKAQQPSNKDKDSKTYHQSAWPMVLSTAGKVCFGLSGVSMAASLGIWNRVSLPKPHFGKKASLKTKAQKPAKPSEQQRQHAQRLGSYVGVFTPTLVIAGQALEMASDRLARREFSQWEKKQAEKARLADFRARFFSR